MKQVQDHYYKKAKQLGVAARSFYKLEEIDQRHQLFKKNTSVLDLGCYPGSWLQYVAERVGPGGQVIGLDLQEVTVKLPEYVHCFQMDIFKLSSEKLPISRFDVVVSDMAPKTTGIRSMDSQRSYALCQQALLVAQEMLVPGGAFVVKIFQGSALESFKQEMRAVFQTVVPCKPKSSRQESVEIFLLGRTKKGD